MKIITMEHTVCDTNCMWNGLEDIYRNRTGAVLPPYFFFALSAFCRPVYVKNSRSPVTKAFYFNSGLPGKMYALMKDVIGFDYKVIENRSFEYALGKAKEQIDLGRPVLLGASDMFHLEYHRKFYHRLHIPVHFILMVGYDDDQKCIYLYDCGKSEVQNLSYDNLEKAWDVSVDGFSKRNTLFVLDFSGQLADARTIFFESLKEKTVFNLNSEVSYAGLNAIRSVAGEIGNWHRKLTREQYVACLLHIVEHSGFPPSIGSGYNETDRTHHGARYKFADILKWGAEAYQVGALSEASEIFMNSGDLINTLSYSIYRSVQDETLIHSRIVEMLYLIAEIEELGFRKIENTLGL